MKPIDFGVFEPVSGAFDANVVDQTRLHDEEVRDLVCLAAFLAPELHRHSGRDRAAIAIKQWADSDTTLLAEAETVAHRAHHQEPAEILHRARALAAA